MRPDVDVHVELALRAPRHPKDLIQEQASRHRDVKRVDAWNHWDADELIAQLSLLAAQPAPLLSQHQHGRAGVLHLVILQRAIRRSSDHLKMVLLHPPAKLLGISTNKPLLEQR